MEKTGSYQSLLNSKLLKGLLSLAFKGYFVQTGWVNSYLNKESLNPNGEPIPWLTYSFLDFLDGRLNKNLMLFEYGAGNSTLFYAQHVKQVIAVEHDTNWFERIKNQMPENVEMRNISLEHDDYVNAILQEDQRYDMVIVDGRKRVACCKNAIERLNEGGVLVLDDSERTHYQPAIDYLVQQGFKHIPFSGIAIGAIHRKVTSLFYKENNCLGI
ncbi:class I SAM-dependent methyltransferase [Sphingobacterium sp. SG20118]|uniref:class I SAM-dependent methyltransferase n=1 Tax=unclassified Sphingobacterium TaxID=2609468 RepID=UPI0004F695DA|nr:class I SAM-dependent methyltransferase [Sphingobacterium sp. ML3W]AIM39210.1 FkbM family methyltransferase [Sphingobacterium sp. ML3W]